LKNTLGTRGRGGEQTLEGGWGKRTEKGGTVSSGGVSAGLTIGGAEKRKNNIAWSQVFLDKKRGRKSNEPQGKKV